MDNFLKMKLSELYPNINVIISNSYEYGEADFKLFKYLDLDKLEGDISIHTSDSDLYLQTIIQQLISSKEKLNRRFTVIKHNSKQLEYIKDCDVLILQEFK